MYSSEFQSNVFEVSEASPSTKLNSASLISGEYVRFTGKCIEGSITLTNYRLILEFCVNTFNIPLGVIDQNEVRKVLCLYIYGKDAKSYKCTFESGEDCLDWQKKLSDAVTLPSNTEQIYASMFYRALLGENPELFTYLCSDVGGTKSYITRANKIFTDEVKRLGFDIHGSWKISTANENYELCPSYPRHLVIPSSISDKTLEGASKFRASRRIPTAVWRHPNGAVIARCSQPEVGWLWWRSSEDEDIVKALAEACAYDSPSNPIHTEENGTPPPHHTHSNSIISSVNDFDHTLSSDGMDRNVSSVSDLSSLCDLPDSKAQTDIKRLLIMDARSYATAVANRARGGGVECLEYYPSCEIQFMNLDNIHTIRKAHHALRNVISLPLDIPNWLSLLESTRWFYHMAGLLRAAVTVSRTVSVEGRPVLVHCSDGWDRTPQITALAQLLLDPYYRTLEGFRVLIEREWIEFGHKFSDRDGVGSAGSDDLNERCPIFLQWMDCVYQVHRQFPTAFQFIEGFLVKIVQHVYSNMFNTFLFNSSRERFANETEGSRGGGMFPIWTFLKLNQHRFVNHLYAQTDRVLYPTTYAKDMVLWNAIYLDNHSKAPDPAPSTKLVVSMKRKGDVGAPPSGELVKTKSCDSLLDQSPTTSVSLTARRCSDPNLTESIGDSEKLLEAGDLKPIRRVSADESTVQPVSDRVPLNVKKKSSTTSEMENESLQTQLLLQSAAVEDFNSDIPKSSTPNKLDKDISLLKSLLDADISTKTPEKPLTKQSSMASDKSEPRERKTHHQRQRSGGGRLIEGKAAMKNGRDKNGDDFICQHMPVTLTSSQICDACKRVWNEAADVKRYSIASRNEIGIDSKLSKTVHSGSVVHPTHRASLLSTDESKSQGLHLRDEYHSIVISDGLTQHEDEIATRLSQIHIQHQLEIECLRRELRATKSFYLHYIQTKLIQANNEGNREDQDSLPESVGSGSAESGGPDSVSDASWEALEEGADSRTTLWVPDHAVDECMSCHSRFWIGRRKHHCRSCGKIFCAECSANSLPVPKENLFEPVRVCRSCFSSFLEMDINCLEVCAN